MGFKPQMLVSYWNIVIRPVEYDSKMDKRSCNDQKPKELSLGRNWQTADLTFDIRSDYQPQRMRVKDKRIYVFPSSPNFLKGPKSVWKADFSAIWNIKLPIFIMLMKNGCYNGGENWDPQIFLSVSILLLATLVTMHVPIDILLKAQVHACI